MTRAVRVATGLLLAAAGLTSGVVAAATPVADAASCVGITIAQGQGLSFDVSSVLVTTGGCVQFANLTDVTVTVKVSGSSFSTRIPARTPASASAAYVVTKSATVTATDGIRTGRGTITTEAPEPTPTVAQTYIPPPVESIAPTHSATPTSTPSATSSTSPAARQTNSPAASLPVLPPLPPGESSAPPAASHPVVAPRVHGSGAQVTATVLDPVSGPRRGLPAIVAVVALIGLATAFGRTVLAAAPPVDRRGRHARPSL